VRVGDKQDASVRATESENNLSVLKMSGQSQPRAFPSPSCTAAIP